ncbi:Tax1-binding protein 1-like protein [Acropora cervicornis]|uniref:Tax1-binding protein 1-like protein n=1 Tax=Acropora cervicornis TaxID=6130 RepID=A0AAD9V854_ACRCE|nr:Tax1-binding protein 1-like protein [Acropora cervicornis]
MAEGPNENESSLEGEDCSAYSFTSLPPESEFSAVIFNNVPEYYPPDRDIECRYTIKNSVQPNSRDWIGLFRVGWQSSREHYTYEWSPLLNTHEQGKPLSNRVVFRERYLPKADDEFYQFCYVTSAEDVRGASVPFQIKTRPLEQDDLQCCEFEDDEGSSIMIVKNKTAILEESLGRALEENASLKASKEMVETNLVNANEEILRLSSQKLELTSSLTENKEKSAQLEETLAQNILIMNADQSRIKELESKVSGLQDMNEISEGKIKELMMVVEKQRAQTSEVEKNKEELVIEKKQYLDNMAADRQMIEKLQTELKTKEDEHNLLKARFMEFKTKAKAESVEYEEKLEKLNATIGRLQEQVTQASAENGILKRNMEGESDRLSKKIRDLHLELKGKDEELWNKQEELANHAHTIADLEKAKEELLNDASQEAELLGNMVEKLQAELNEKQELLHQLEHELEDFKEQLDHEKEKAIVLEKDCETVIRALQEQIDGEKALNQSLCSQSDRHLAELQGQLQKQLEANMELTVQLESRNADIRGLSSELDGCKRKLQDEEEKAQKAETQITATSAELKSLRVVKESLQSTLDDAQGANARSSKITAASMFALQTAHAHLEKKYLKIKKEMEELWRERNELKRSLAAFQENVPSDDIRLQIEELRANNEDFRVRLNMGAEAYKVKFIECRQLEAQLNKLKRSSSVESFEPTSSSVVELQSEVRNLQKALNEEKRALDMEQSRMVEKNEEINQLKLKVLELTEKAERYECLEHQNANRTQSQLIVEDLSRKVASLEKNLELERKEKEGIVHAIVDLQAELKSTENDLNNYAEKLRVTQEALKSEQRDREILGQQARSKLQEHEENECKLTIKVKELEREVARWKQEVDLRVEAESRMIESEASSEEGKPQFSQQQRSSAMRPVRGIRPSCAPKPTSPSCGSQPWVVVSHPPEFNQGVTPPAASVQPPHPQVQLQQPHAPAGQQEIWECPVCTALLPPNVDKDQHVNGHFD